MDDREFERRLEDAESRRSYGGGGYGRDSGGDIFSDMIDDLLPFIIIVGVVLGGIAFLDNQFGWGILEWLKSLF